MVVQPVAGAISDRRVESWGRFPPLGVTIVVTVAALLAFAAADSLALVVVAYFFVQIAANAGQAVHQALLPDVVDRLRHGRAAGVKGFMDLAGALLGFALLGWLLEDKGTLPAVAAVAAVLCGTFAVARLLVGRPRRRAPAPPRVAGDGFRADRTTGREFVRIIASRFLFLLGTYAVGRFFLLFVADRLGVAAREAAEEAGAVWAGWPC